MRIAVASGKGGTGKTTVAVNLAVTAARAGLQVHLCDCDVEEPDAGLFLDPVIAGTSTVAVPVPVIDPQACSHCGLCAGICAFNAIACLPGSTLAFPELCHGCGGCLLVCPTGALTLGERPLGEVARGSAGGIAFSEGRLRVGETVVPPLIRAVKATVGEAPLVILDSPPGTACPVVETLRDADFVLLVTEPTPFGEHDLALMARLARTLGKPCGVVVNRTGKDTGRSDRFCADLGLPILARIPFGRAVAAACATGSLAVDADPQVAAALDGLLAALQSLAVAP